MGYWLTIHWPSSKNEDDYPGVWVRAQRPEIADEICEGDMVAIYETLNDQDGRPARPPGAQRVIAFGNVTELCPHAPAVGEIWVLRARLTADDCEGASLCDVREILGDFRPNHQGLQRISEQQFNQLTLRVLP